MLPTIDLQDDVIIMVDQRKLPGQEVLRPLPYGPEVAKAIRTMVIRGAPAIGVAAAMRLALGMKRSTAKGRISSRSSFQKTCDLMAATRPTAVNLFWAIDRMKRAFAGRRAGRGIRPRSSSRGSRARPRRSTTRTSPTAARWARTARTSCPTARAC